MRRWWHLNHPWLCCMTSMESCAPYFSFFHTITIVPHLRISPLSHYAIQQECWGGQWAQLFIEVQMSMECKLGNRQTAEEAKTYKVCPIDSQHLKTHFMTLSRNKKSKRVDKAKPFHDFAKWISCSENPFISFGPVLRLGLGMLPLEEDEDKDIVPM